MDIISKMRINQTSRVRVPKSADLFKQFGFSSPSGSYTCTPGNEDAPLLPMGLRKLDAIVRGARISAAQEREKLRASQSSPANPEPSATTPATNAGESAE